MGEVGAQQHQVAALERCCAVADKPHAGAALDPGQLEGGVTVALTQ